MISFRPLIPLSLLLTTAVLAQDNRPGMVMTCSKPGVFALTFDDGPSEHTKQLLDILHAEDIKATFFVLGKAVDDPLTGHWTKTAYDLGHQIAIHTYDHPHLNSLTLDGVRSQVERTEKALQKVIGTIPYYFRPPYGECSPANQHLLEEMGYLIIQWNVDSNDWRYMSDPKKFPLITHNFEAALAKMDGHASAAISLQHDIHKFSIDQTKGIIDMIKAKGFAFETIADCLANPRPYYRTALDPAHSATHSTSDPTNSHTGDHSDQVKGAGASSKSTASSTTTPTLFSFSLFALTTISITSMAW